jgi:fibronectin type 3 domain-containing protein
LVESPPAGLSKPQGLRAVSGELRVVALQWEPVLDGDVAGYAVERAEGEEAPLRRVGWVLGRFTTTYVDGGSTERTWGLQAPKPGSLRDGGTYRYRVRAFDTHGRLGSLASDEAQATTAPLPAPPADLRAYSHLPRQVALTWKPSDDPTVRGYVLYRSPSQQGAYEPIAQTEGRFRDQRLDEGLGDLRVFYYRITAVNAAGGEGPKSDPVRAVTKAEPLPPVELRVIERRLGGNWLEWDPNVERDITGYRLLRWREGEETPELVAEIEADETQASDKNVAAGELVTYRVVSIDQDGLESAASDPVIVVSEQYELAAEVLPEALRLRWRPRTEEGFVAARVLRSGLLRWHELARVSGDAHLDEDVEPGRSYRYQVVLERADGDRAPASKVLEVVMPERGH